LKTMKFSYRADGILFPAHPTTKLGLRNEKMTIEITDIPDDAPMADVRNLIDKTAVIPRIDPRTSFRYDELGEGKILR